MWGAVVARRLGFDWEEALTLGRAVAGLNAHAKGVSLGMFEPKPKELKEKRAAMREGDTLAVELMHRAVPCIRTPDGVRALEKGRPARPETVQRYLESKFGDSLDEAIGAMNDLAGAFAPERLAEKAYGLYEEFRPAIPSGKKGWGAKGDLDLGRLRALAE